MKPLKVVDARYNAIKRRHDNIPQEPLIEIPEGMSAKRKTGAKQRGPRSIRFVKCPFCLADRASDGSEVFRDHYKVLNSGTRIPCRGSGRVAPE